MIGHRASSASLLLVALTLLVVGGCKVGDEASQVGTPFPLMDAAHIPTGQSFEGYNSNPPSSGPHWAVASRCGVYPEGLPNEVIVHNLEHGNVIISYNLTATAEVERLTRLVQGLREWGRWGVLRSYTDMPQGQVALTAWGVLDTAQGVDEARITSFWTAYAPNRLSGETKRAGPIPCAQ